MNQQNDKWEYHILVSPSQFAEEYLNNLGAEGWEMAGIIDDTHFMRARIFMKRKLKASSPKDIKKGVSLK